MIAQQYQADQLKDLTDFANVDFCGRTAWL
mgnify:CR=1 FL=1